MTQYIIYHQVKLGTDCPDGIAAAWVAHRAYRKAQVLGWTYQQVQESELPQVVSGDVVIVVDFSFPESVLIEWEKRGVNALILDHHVTAQEQLKQFQVENLERFLNQINKPRAIAAFFDMSECGATLAWKVLHYGKPMPAFLKYIKDRDLWNFLLEDTPVVHEALSTLRYNTTRTGGDIFELFDAIASLDEKDLLTLLRPIGEPLVEPKRRRVAEVAARGKVMELAGHQIIGVTLNPDGSEDRLVSDVGMKLYRDNPDVPFVAMVTADGSWELRSDKHGNNFDVGAIASSFGGGGHRNAAGFNPNSKKGENN